MRYIPGIAMVLLVFSLAAAVSDNPQIQSVRGHLVSVDVLTRTLVIKTDAESGTSREMSFVTDDASKIVRNGKTVPLRGLRPGDAAAVRYKALHGKSLVVSIALTPKE